MGIYIGLIIFILFLPIMVQPFYKTSEKRRNAIAFWGMLAIFLVLALKGDTVGYDIAGYKEQYIVSAKKAWDDVDYVYFEPGYITLTKIFSKAGVSFQLFMAFVYALACSSIYFFVKKYSKSPAISILIFICYQFFVFYVSGVRQTIAMSLCLIAYMVSQCKAKRVFFISLLINIVAISIHTSAIIFFVVLIFSLVKSKKINIVFWIFLILASIVFRPLVWELVNEFFREVDVNTEMLLAGNFIFLCCIGLFMYFVNPKSNILQINLKSNSATDEEEKQNVFFTRMIFVSICTHILFSGHTLLRSAMYPMMFIIPGLPNTTRRLESKFRLIAEYAMVVFFIALFYLETLASNQLGICPYIFFWE